MYKNAADYKAEYDRGFVTRLLTGKPKLKPRVTSFGPAYVAGWNAAKSLATPQN